jgi:HPt (histidine-containing phosphotransfer) domain-containing protein
MTSLINNGDTQLHAIFVNDFAQVAEQRNQQQQHPAKVRGFRVLAVTLHETSHSSLKYILEEENGYETTVVSSIDDAITVLTNDEQSKFDVLLLDVEQQDEDPNQFINYMREIDQDSKHYTAVIVITENNDTKQLIENSDMTLLKPVTLEGLMKVVENCIEISLNYAESVDMSLAVELTGDEEFMKELLCEFIEQAQSQLIAIKQSIDDVDWKALNDVSHSIKGAAAQLACKPLAHAAFILERAAKEEDSSVITSLSSFDRLQLRLTEVEQFVTKLME